MSITIGEFQTLTVGYPIWSMQPVAETRRQRLEQLIAEYGSAAALNAKLGWTRTDPKLAQIRNANTRAGRDKPYQMGDAMARQIEDALALPNGWMDTPLEASDPSDMRIREIVKLLEGMEGWQVDQAMKIIDAIKEPARKSNGTEG